MHRVHARAPRRAPLAFAFCLVATVSACSSNSDPRLHQDQSKATDESTECTPKAQGSCPCDDDTKGTRTCSKAGEWGECICPEPTSDDDADESSDEREGDDDSPSPDGSDTDGGKSAGEATHALPCDVSALLTTHCGECHGKRTAFGAPMSLVTWEDLKAAAPKHDSQSVFERVLARVQDDKSPMPPAPNARLSAAEIATLTKWVEAGAPQGQETCQDYAGPSDSGGGVPKPDDCEDMFELRAHEGASESDTSKFKISATPALEGNQYHCFYFDPPYDADAGMFWFEPIIDNKANLHHWILYATDNKTQPSGTSAACNANEVGAYFVVGWAPGANNTTIDKDVALQLPAGPNAGLILEVHYYNDTGTTQEDASGVRFCTGKKSSRAHTATVHTLGSEGICLQPGEEQTVSGTCAPRTDMGDVHITGLWPHMHKSARHMSLIIHRSTGSSEMVHDEPFAFDNQIFFPKKDVVVHPGDTVETRCTFENDTSSAIHYGERTQDEMCYAFVMAWPAGGLASPSTGLDTGLFSLNRCAEPLSILESCNGIADAPVTVEHP